jgi:hypothetical protein
MGDAPAKKKKAAGKKAKKDPLPEKGSEAFFERNMQAFKEASPQYYNVLSNIEEVHSKLIFDEDGDADVEFRGNRLYDMGSNAFSEQQTAEFWKAPFRMHFYAPQTSLLDDVAGDFNYDILHRGVDDGIEFLTRQSGTESHYLIVYGVGLGAHIESLVEKTKCKGLVLVEPNQEFIYHSLYLFNWADILKEYTKEGKNFVLIVSKDYKEIAHDIRNFVRGICPSFFDGTFIYSHYQNSILEMADERMKKDARLFLSGLGFIEDEYYMVRNSYKNLRDYDGYIYQRSKTIRKMPAFVIGSGPSLDKNFEHLRKNRDKAIYISCGTALGVLLANGIVPDFHMEMENVELVYDLLKEKTEKYDTENICLVGSTTIDPRVKSLFPNRVLFFRQVLASWEIFSLGENSGLYEVGPTVTNAGFSFAEEIGCPEIYLFGVDYGSRRRDQHHAKDSDYRPGGKADYSDDLDLEHPGNFGGIIYTHGVFIWARSAVEQCIRRFRRGRNFYNCSDGMLIDGAVPKASKTISLPEDVDKESEIEDIKKEFLVYSKEIFEEYWERKEWSQDIADLCDDLIGFCRDSENDEDEERDDKKYMSKIARRLIPRGMEPGADIMLVRGSILMIMISASYYLARVSDPEKHETMVTIVREEFIAILEKIKKDTTTFYQELVADDYPSKNDE